MGTIKDVACKGCTVCPVIATNLPSDSVNFVTKVNCLKGELTGIDKLDYAEIERRMLEMYEQYGQRFPDTRQYGHSHGLPQANPLDQHIPHGFFDSQKKVAEEMARRESIELARIDQEAMALAMRVPGIGPLWENFIQRGGHERTSKMARLFLQVIGQMMNLFSPEAAKAEVVRSRKELIDLCERVVRAWDRANDKMDMQDAIEELDSLLYDLDKREGLNG
jgi:hypothetical protein